uniref:Uncharacterized protein n=1 Tax=Glycine max TaxID=3847 RepID=A0A0R0LC17_SOYBN
MKVRSQINMLVFSKLQSTNNSHSDLCISWDYWDWDSPIINREQRNVLDLFANSCILQFGQSITQIASFSISFSPLKSMP